MNLKKRIGRKPLLALTLVAGCLFVAQAENLYRTQINGGEWQYWETIADAVGNSVSKADGSISTVVIELLKDDSTTFDSALVLGRNGSSGGYSRRTCVIRSSTEGGSTARYTLKRTNAAAQMRASMPSYEWISVAFTNIVLDGGAVWTNPSDLSSTANSGVGAGSLFEPNNTYKAEWHFGENVVFRNFQTTATTGIFYGPYSNWAGTYFLDGVTIENCRGGCLACLSRQLTSFQMKDSVATNCASGANGLFYFINHIQATSFAYGRKSFEDVTIKDNLIGGNAAINFTGANPSQTSDVFPLAFASKVEMSNNRLSSGACADLKYSNLAAVEMTGSLDAGSSIAVVLATAPEVGAEFGFADDAAFTGANAFRWAGNNDAVSRFGSVDGDAKLVWVAGKPSVIEYTKVGYTNVADGVAHTIGVTVTNLEGYDYEITYSETEEGTYTTEKPTYTEAGDYTVWFKIVSDGCATVKDKAGVRLDSIEGYVYRTRIDGGGWTYHDELSDVANVISQECYQARQTVIDVEMLQDDTTTFDRALNFGYGASGKGTVHQTRYVNFRSCPLLKTRFMLKKAATAARFNLRCHGPATYWTFDNVTLDGGAKWSDPDDPLSTAQEAGGIGAGQFIDMDNASYLNHIVLTNMTLRNCQMPATVGAEPDGLFYMSYNASSLTLEAGTEVVDCRGGLLVSFIRRMAGLVLRGGTITRCGGGASGLFFLKGHSGAPKTDPVGARAICGTVITNNRVTASGVFTGDALARYHLSGSPIVTENYLADGTTPANIRAESHTNVIVTGALTSPAESVGVSSPDATKLGDVFAVLDSGVAGEGLAAFRFDTSDTAVALKGALSAGGEPVWTNGTIRVITYVKADWEGYVDGKGHAPQIVVRAPATAVASYALDPAGPWFAEKPQLTAVGDYTVYVKIVAPNCPDVTDSVKVTVHDESYVPANKWRVRIEGGAWQDAADWAAVEKILAQLYYTTDLTAEVELMSLTEALDREVTFGAYSTVTPKTVHSDNRRITVRTRADNGQCYTIRRTAQDARFRYSGHGMTAISFENIVLDGGAKWADAADLTSLTQLEGGVAAHTDDFLTRGSYASSFTFATNSVFRNFAFSASHGIRSLTSVGDDAVNILPGALVTDCRGGPLVNYARHTGNLTVGGEITRCSSPNSLFNLSTSTGVLNYKHGVHIVTNGCVHGNVVGNSGNVVSVDKYCFVEFGGAPVITDNRRVNGTVANVCAGGTSNLVLTTALDAAGGAKVGVRIGSTVPYRPECGEVFGTATGFADDISKTNPAEAFYAEDRHRRVGTVQGGKLVWGVVPNGLAVIVK